MRPIAVLLLSACFHLVSPPSASLAQVFTNIRPDLSVGTHVDLDVNPGEHHIGAGEIRGNALFHSFETFSLGTGEMARFLDPFAGIEFIFSRVTGMDMVNDFRGSTIDGTLISDIPGANFYFMNPRGIIFGPNAFLDIGAAINGTATGDPGQPGSAYFTTANYIELTGGFRFKAVLNAPPESIPADSLLTVPPVVAFGFLAPPEGPATPAPITVQGSFLETPFFVDPATIDPDTGIGPSLGQTLALIGGDINMAADPETGFSAVVSAPSGKIELASIRSSGEVVRSPADGELSINATGALGNITVSDVAFVDTTDINFGLGSLGDGRGGTIVIRGGILTVETSSFVTSITQGDVDGAPVGIDILVNSLAVTGGSQIEAANRGDMGKGGQLLVTARDTISISGSDSSIFSESSGSANSGQVIVKSQTLNVNDSGSINTQTQGALPAEDLIVNVSNLNVTNAGRLFTQTTSPDVQAGNLTVQGMDGAGTEAASFVLSGENAAGDRSGIRSLSSAGGGPTGNLSIFARSGTIDGGARIGGDILAANQAGRIDVAVSETLTISGRDASGFPSAILNVSAGGGQSGDVNVNAGILDVNGGLIQSHSVATGQSGNLNVTGTSSINVRNQGNISSIAVEKDVGNVTIDTPSLLVDNGSITASTIGAGDAGNINIMGKMGSVTVTNNGTISTSTSSSGNAGSITANVGTATLTNNARIASSSIGTATGAAGSVTIKGLASPANAVAVTNSTIATSAANTGRGGSITVDATNLMLNNATVSASVNNFGMAPDGPTVGLGNIGLTASTMTMTGGTVTAETSGSRNAGTVNIAATGNTLTLTNNAEIASSSTGMAPGSGKAGSVTIDAGSQFVSENSKVTVGTEKADGGDITLNATTLIHLIDSQITATVKGGEGKGGNVSIDPSFVLLENSSITANAFGGPGGNINIVAGTFLSDPASSVTASSAFSAQGTVNIQSPVQNISTSLAPLPRNFTSAAALLAQRCAARAPDAKFSTFVLAGRDGVPLEPGGLLPSPLIAANSSGPGMPTATGGIQADADTAPLVGNPSASLGGERFALALADDACGK